MSSADHDDGADRKGGPVFIYSMSSLLAEEARRGGFAAFAADVEAALAALLSCMTETQQRTALMLACNLTEAADPPPLPPRLRLVSSRV